MSRGFSVMISESTAGTRAIENHSSKAFQTKRLASFRSKETKYCKSVHMFEKIVTPTVWAGLRGKVKTYTNLRMLR